MSGRVFLAALRKFGWPNDPPLRTLCQPCHRSRTSEQAKARRAKAA